MVTGNRTIGQIIHDLLLVESTFDVKYYRDLYRKQPAIPFHEASVQRILRVWMRSAKIY